jgi:hypothetical protein
MRIASWVQFALTGCAVIAWAKQLGPHWFAFESYHTMR